MKITATLLVILMFLFLGWSLFLPDELLVGFPEKEKVAKKKVEKSYADIFQSGPVVYDLDSNRYQSVTIGDQAWLAANLQLNHCNSNSSGQLLFASGLEEGPNVKFVDGKPRYGYYDNKPNLGHGVIYNYLAIKQCKLCPQGYRLPSVADWERLIELLGKEDKPGHKLRQRYQSLFAGGLGGNIDSYGSLGRGNHEHYWTSDQSPDHHEHTMGYIINVRSNGSIRIQEAFAIQGAYVRCIRE